MKKNNNINYIKNYSLQLLSISLIFVTFVSGSNQQLNIVRGIAPADLIIYTQPKFTCDDGAVIIDKSAINDNFCDCDDGKDEPGTNACPDGMLA
jgi:hypothetical protein